MEKRVFIVLTNLILSLFLISSVLAVSNSADSEIKSITHYAEEYEIGNIDYVKLLVYISASKQNLNEILGATNQQMGGVLKQEKIREILGEPSEETKWVWVEGEEQDKKLDSPVPVWKKIVFDGKKIQISLDAFPSIFTKKQFDNEGDNKDEQIKGESDEGSIKEGDLIYRLNFWIEFKKPEEQLDINRKINEIKSLAEKFNSDPSQSNAEILAKESVNTEKTFESYFRQNQGKCENVMSSIFGSENQMPNQNMIVQEISFYEGEKFEAIARLEMCDDCEWNWINLNLWLETRGLMPKMEESKELISPDQYKNKDVEYYKSEIKSLLDDYKEATEQQNWKELNTINMKIQAINEAWNQKANDVWKDVEQKNDVQSRTVVENKVSKEDNQDNVVVENTGGGSNSDSNIVVENTITGNFITGNAISENNNDNKQSKENNDPYFWIKQDQERRKQEKTLRKQNYEERKQFYMTLFSGYDKKEYSFAQIEFKKRLIELFREKGEEICNNNIDDNKNEQIDCDDDQCGGKICGKGKSTISNGNETKDVEVDFYCIAKECKAKEVIVEIKGAVCGNHVCEGNETIENCAEDCTLCPQYAPIECSGKVIFKGKDEDNCSLEPICIEEQTCVVNEDCKFLCGNGQCVEGKCQVKELSECSEQECDDGTQKTMNCESGENIISSMCSNGLWTNTGLACPGTIEEGEVEEEIVIGDVVGNQCTSLSDCGGENDVCSNGQCVTLPERIEVEETEELENIIEKPETNVVEEEKEQTSSEIETAQIQESPQQETETANENSEPEVTEQTKEQPESITGNVIFSIKEVTGKITGFVIGLTGFDVEGGDNGDSGTSDSQSDSSADTGQEATIEPEQDNQPPQENQQPMENFEDNRDDERREEDNRRKEEDNKRNEENKERCKKDCARPCIDKCIRENCGQEMDCNIDGESKKCEETCKPEDTCVEKCTKGEGEWWKEFENKEEFKEQLGGFEAGGNCRTEKGKTNGFIWFGGWGDPFEKIQPLKNKYYSRGNADWCKFELQNLIKQREEFEKGFNQEFAKWFFEEYLANSAENWEQAVSEIFELYWKNVDNQREMAFRMKCMDKSDIKDVMNYNLINIKYETEYGKLEYWEEVKTVKIPGIEEEVTIISPYMKTWIFPSKEFIIFEMKQAMKNREFPGSPEDKMERKNEEGMTAEEKEMIKQDEGFMKLIRTMAEKYGGSLDAVVQFKDLTTNEIVFNLYAQVNEKDIIKMTPMLPEEVTEKDVTAEIDFEKIYELIYSQEKEMRGEQIESPPWDKKMQPVQGIKNMVNGAKMYFKVRDIMNSATFTPTESEGDIKKLFKKVFSMMGREGESGGEENKGMNEEKNIQEDKGAEEGVWDSKEIITGQVIFSE
ncbi:MAG: hypothetical protein Q7S74_02995 [Nanoarchaeota archaeon]|nr:hypothetical protein [Nanoarchaeota archaeon]